MCVSAERTEVLWRGCGEAVTIQCRSSESHLKHLELKKGLYKHVSVLQKSENQSEIGQGFTGRVQEHGALPNIDVLIKNLSSDDTGPYWCMYRQSKEKEGKQRNGSVLVVVKGKLITLFSSPHKKTNGNGNRTLTTSPVT